VSRLQDDQKRYSIVKAAFRTFGELGFRNTTMKQIASEAGIAPGSIYTYFRDKDELFRTAIDEGWKDFLSTFDAIVKSDRPLHERIDQLVTIAFQRLRESLPLLRGMLFDAGQMPTFRDNLNSLSQYVVILLEEGRKRGLLALEPDGSWKELVRVVVHGSLFSVALSPQAETEAELSAARSVVQRLIRERLGMGAAR
jgi:AcrR family transcriptional regulator